MILIGLGGNLTNPEGGTPETTLELAVAALREAGIKVLARSRWYETAPVPVSDQPLFVNGVVSVRTPLSPEALLQALHGIEQRFGRVRGERNAARTLDLDLLDYEGLVRDGSPNLPHPRMHQRAFVLFPLRELVPDWRHPSLKLDVEEMIATLPPGQEVRPLPP